MLAYQPSLQDSESFSKLFARTQLVIFRFIYGLHGGPIQEVEDLTCDTYLRAWKGRKSFTGDDHAALCWLFTIARHLVIDAHRRRKSHLDDNLERLDDATLDTLSQSSEQTPEEMASSREQFTHLWKLLQGLPPDKRELLVLRYLLGWQIKEIASYSRMQENTVSVYIRRSLAKIRVDWSSE
jgi:RNA polymerase sigma-70 factor (ECF subfamily)